MASGWGPTRWDFFDPEVKKLKNLVFLGEISLTQTKDGWLDLTQPNQQKIEPTQSGSKKFDPDPSLVQTQAPTLSLWPWDYPKKYINGFQSGNTVCHIIEKFAKCTLKKEMKIRELVYRNVCFYNICNHMFSTMVSVSLDSVGLHLNWKFLKKSVKNSWPMTILIKKYVVWHKI